MESIVAAGFLSLLHFKTSANWVSAKPTCFARIGASTDQTPSRAAETNQRAYLPLLDLMTIFTPSSRRDGQHWTDHLQRIGSLLLGVMPSNRTVWPIRCEPDRSQRSEQMDDAIITRRIKGLPYAKSVVASNRQSGTMDAIQDVVGQMRAEETRLLERHRADSEAWAITTGSFTAVFFLLTAIVFALCGLLMKMALSSQAQAERLLQTLSRSSTAPAAR